MTHHRDEHVMDVAREQLEKDNMTVAFVDSETGEVLDGPATRRARRESEESEEPKRRGLPFKWNWKIAFWVTLGILFLSHLGYAMDPPLDGPGVPLSAYPACPTEDSANCFWDAKEQGNGEGTSFVDVDGSKYIINP